MKIQIFPVISLILYILIILVTYIFVIHQIFPVYFPINPDWPLRFIIFILGCIAVLIQYKPEHDRPGTIFHQLLIINPLCPLLVLYLFNGFPTEILFLCIFGSWIFGVISQCRLSNSIYSSIEVRGDALSYFSLIVFLSFIVAYSGSFSLNFDWAELYDVRFALRDTFTELPLLVRYFLIWIPTIILPILMTVCYVRRSWLQLIILIPIIIIIFGMINQKSVLFIPLYFIAIRMALELSPRVGLIYLHIFIVAMSIFTYNVFNDLSYATIVVRRAIYIPALVNIAYFDVFKDLPFVFLSSSFLGAVIPYPFEQSPPFLVGDRYFSTPNVNVNSGFLGTAYMHFGYAGFVILPALLGAVSVFVNSLRISRVAPIWVASLMLSPVGVIFSSADIITGLMTNGYLFGILLMTFSTWTFLQERPRHAVRTRLVQSTR